LLSKSSETVAFFVLLQ